MASEEPDLGKGLFGYRKSTVHQVIADRDVMLQQAEGRVRAAEGKVAELEAELGDLREQNSRIEEQLERLRSAVDGGAGQEGPATLAPENEAPGAAASLGQAQPDDLPDYEVPSVEVGPSEPEAPAAPEWGPQPLDKDRLFEEWNLPDEAFFADRPEDQDAPAGSAEAAPAASASHGEPHPEQEAKEPGPAGGQASRFLTEEIGSILAAAEESAARIVDRAREASDAQVGEADRLWREVQADVARLAGWRRQLDPVMEGIQARVQDVHAQVEEVPERIRQALAPMAEAMSAIDAELAELTAVGNPPLLLTPSGFDQGDEEGDLAAQGGPEAAPEVAGGDPPEADHPHGPDVGATAG